MKEVGIVGQREEEVGGGPGGRRPYGSAHRAAQDGSRDGCEEVLEDLEGQVHDGAEVRAASSLPAHLRTKEYRQYTVPIEKRKLWRPTFNVVQFVILLWRDFICVKISQWYASKSASRLYVTAKGGILPPSVFNVPCSCEH